MVKNGIFWQKFGIQKVKDCWLQYQKLQYTAYSDS